MTVYTDAQWANVFPSSKTIKPSILRSRQKHADSGLAEATGRMLVCSGGSSIGHFRQCPPPRKIKESEKIFAK